MGNMLETFRNAFRLPDLRKRLLFTVFMVILFRIGGNIPVPGIDRHAFTDLINRFDQLGTLMDIMSGGALMAVSIFAMGITPYINSSIIIQLLTVAIPALERLSREGETGRKKIQQIVRVVPVVLALIQATAFWYATRTAAQTALPTWLSALVVIGSFTAGTAVIMWIGELINAKGIGNGISIIIFAGIISRIPKMITGLGQLIHFWSELHNFLVAIIFAVLCVLLIVLGILFVLYIQLSERRIRVQYSQRVVGNKRYGGQKSYLPIKVNQSGVIPVIFAISLMQIPSLLVSYFWPHSESAIVRFFMNFGRNPLYYILEGLLIIGFTFFYSMIQFNPVEVANNMQKNGGFIAGHRPGMPTARYLGRVSRRLCWFDGLFLAVITLLPMIIGTATGTSGLWFGGTAIIIIVGVCLDLANQLESQMMMRHYRGFLD